MGRLLASSGLLAFITHSDRQGGRLIDPAGLLTRTARNAGLPPLDRVALLQIPIRDGALAPEPAPPAVLPVDDEPFAPVPWRMRVHADLLLFARPRHGVDPMGEEPR